MAVSLKLVDVSNYDDSVWNPFYSADPEEMMIQDILPPTTENGQIASGEC